MTHSTTVVREGNGGDHTYVVADVDISSLDSAGAEPFDAGAEFSMDFVLGASVEGQANAGYQVAWDHVNEQIAVKHPTSAHGHNVPGDSSGTTANAEFDANGNLAVGAGGSIEGAASSTADDVAAGTNVGEVRLVFKGDPAP